MNQGWALGWRSRMAAEIYVTILTGFGLGHLLHYGRELNAMDQGIGVMLVIVVIGLLADKMCLRHGSAFSIGDAAQDEPEWTRSFLYEPTEAYFDKSWQLPHLKVLNC